MDQTPPSGYSLRKPRFLQSFVRYLLSLQGLFRTGNPKNNPTLQQADGPGGKTAPLRLLHFDVGFVENELPTCIHDASHSIGYDFRKWMTSFRDSRKRRSVDQDPCSDWWNGVSSRPVSIKKSPDGALRTCSWLPFCGHRFFGRPLKPTSLLLENFKG